MQQSTKSFGEPLLTRAQRFQTRQRYSGQGPDLEMAMLDDLAVLKQEASNLEAQNKELLKRQVKLEGLINRLERQLKKSESDHDKLTRDTKTLVKQLENEHARAEKFKFAYSELRDHPLVKAARGLKNPLALVKPTPSARRAEASELDNNPDMSVSPEPTRKRETKAGELKIEAKSSVEQNRQIVLECLAQYRNDGELVRPARTLEQLSKNPFDPNSFGAMQEQLLGQARLFAELPSIPPRTGTAAYTPYPDRVMYCAHSTGEYNSNGYSTRTTGLTTAIAEAGIDLFIVARPGYPWDFKVNRKLPKKTRLIREFQGVKTHFNPGVSLKDDPLDKFIQIAADIYVREAMMKRPSVIVSASNHITALPALIAARRLGVPFIYEVRGLWEVTAAAKNQKWGSSERFELAKRLEALVVNEADQAFAITEEVRDELVNRGAEREKISILPNAANIFQYVPLPPERSKVALQKKPDEYLLGYAGSLVEYEGLDLLIDAIKLLPTEFDHVGLLIVGDGEIFADLKEQVVRLGLQERVRFTGRVENERINDYLAIFDAVVCPRKSNIVTELVSPLKPIEAMAAGRPVIGSDVSPIANLLGRDGVRGLLFSADDVQALADKIVVLARSPKQGQDIGRRARKWTVENRTWSIVAKTFVEQVANAQKRIVAEKKLSDLKLAIIADEFTTSTISRELEIVVPTPTNWKDELQKTRVDALFVESAWAGNSGAWTRKIGYYEDEECADLAELVEHCRQHGIPAIFWNKEDPVHFNRFQRTAALFDVVLTTDANCLPKYWDTRGSNLRALGSLPFWAQAEIHNPLGSDRPYVHSVAYGGTFYGERYAERSKELRMILEGVRAEGLTIYDRQAESPDSPYKFPASLQDFVQGGLSYPEMVEAYKSHPVHINVNSVNASPTMFSRRVFELGACGTPVISGKSFGMTWMFDGAVPVVRNRQEAELIAGLWMNSEPDRVFDGWVALRETFRRHLAHQRLALALRMAGIAVEIQQLPTVGVKLSSLTLNMARSILGFSLRPDSVIVSKLTSSSEARELLTEAGIGISENLSINDCEVIAEKFESLLHDETALEDMMIALHYGNSERVQTSEDDIAVRGLPLWMKAKSEENLPTIKLVDTSKPRNIANIRLRRMTKTVREQLPDPANTAVSSGNSSAKNILIAGHDLKFAGQIMQAIEDKGHSLSVDQWIGHAQHDPEKSRLMLENADLVFCEWSLGNLVWYSKHLNSHQKLVTRFHSQELFTDYPAKVDFSSVSKVIFVSKLIRGMAIQKFRIPAEKTIVIPNAVDTLNLKRPKLESSKFVLGFVGMVPQMKRFDLVLDLLENLRRKDLRFTLRVKGKRPEDYPWMAAREDEMEFYEKQYERIENSKLLNGAVTFDPQGDDMPEWYQQIGIAVSTSDFESFHFTLADGAASEALPVGLAWPGSEWLYPQSWLHSDIADAANSILETLSDNAQLSEKVSAARAFTLEKYDSEKVLNQILTMIEQ